MKKPLEQSKWVGWVVLAVGGVCLTAGLVMGQYSGVLRKAVFICLECIGIG